MNPLPISQYELLRRLLADQEECYRREQPLSVEVYLRQYPDLHSRTEDLLTLIYNEIVLREQRGERPLLEEYSARFPALAEDLALQFEAHSLLGSLTPVADPANTAAPGEEVNAGPDYSTRVPDGEVPLPFFPGLPELPGYEILQTLGEGGMGVVYKARQIHPGRIVAVKMILGGAHAGSEYLLRFRTEAAAAARLEHPNVVRLYEYGQYNGLPYFTLECVAGGSLHGRLRGQPLLPEESARIVEQLARGMAHAHQHGIVHRDLKPANVLLAEDATPKITDFGLAKLLDEKGRTVTGAVMGTPSYMAPEQARGKTAEVGPAADIYALGAILYECLTGRPPFQGTNAVDILARVIADEPVPPSRLVAGVPRDLETICLKCMEKEASRRYSNAESLADDLQCYRSGKPIAARPVGGVERFGKWMRRRPAVATALGTALALVAVVVVALVVVIISLGETKEALTERDRVARERALARVNALREAAPGAVPVILEELEDARDDVLPRLRELWRDESDPRKRMRIGLALLPIEPEAVREDLVGRLFREEVPDEVLLVRAVLTPHSAGLREPLWAKAEDEKSEPKDRFRSLVALAAFDPGNTRWKKAAPTVVKQMLLDNRLHLGAWVTGLRPVCGSLMEPLREAYRTGKSAEQREFAATVLSDYAADQPDVLADLLLDADPKQYAILFPILDRYREQAIERMRREVKGDGFWNDSPIDPSWREPGAELRREIEAAEGLLAKRWALCQTLPLERWNAVVEAMRGCGYRPVRLRPYVVAPPGADGSGSPPVRVAGVWTRDGRAFQAETGLTATGVKERDAVHQKAGFIPADLAGYGSEGVRFAALWVKPAKKGEARLYLDVPAAAHKQATDALKSQGFDSLTLQGRLGTDRQTHFCGVWWKGDETLKQSNCFWNDRGDAHKGRVLLAEQLLGDVAVSPTPRPQPLAQWCREVIEKTVKELAAKPEEFNALYRRAIARFYLYQNAAALADLDVYLEKGTFTMPFVYRARLHARAGRAEKARADLAEFGKRSTSMPLKVFATAIVELHLGEENALPKLEAAVKASPNHADLLFNAACVYAQASFLEAARQAMLAAGTIGSSLPAAFFRLRPVDLPREHADRALALLRQALDCGSQDLDDLDKDPDLEPIRSCPQFQPLRLSRGRDRVFASVWHGDANREAADSHGLPIGAHLEFCRELAAQGYRPAALSVIVLDEGKTVTASAWHRPFPKRDERERLARRQATGALTLLKMDATADAWPLFRHRPDPEARSQLIWRSGLLAADPKQIVQRLNEEKDTSARRALILTLGEFTADQLPPSLREPLTEKLLGWYRDDPDPGIHGAIDWLLRHDMEGLADRPLKWGQAARLKKADEELKVRDAPVAGGTRNPSGGRRWYVNGQGQTMVLIPGPVEFRMGSPPWDDDKRDTERPHRRRISRGFAIASCSVTVDEFKRFVDDRPDVRGEFPGRYSPVANGPAIGVNWFTAAQYCNWLSEKEQIPDSEWCYPKHTDINKDMKPYPDYLKRKGYRLPTDAEWEYAARAEATPTRHYGSSVELLPRYAWFLQNSSGRAWPVGQKRPNDLGLFDIQGNVWNWVYDPGNYFPQQQGTTTILDKEDVRYIKDNDLRVSRGGSFAERPSNVRSSLRYGTPPSIRSTYIGLRVARTYD